MIYTPLTSDGTYGYIPFEEHLNSPVAWSLDTDIIDGDSSTTLRFVQFGGSNDFCWIPRIFFQETPRQFAYGTWEFRVIGTDSWVIFIASDADKYNGATQNGYAIRLGSNIKFYRIDNGAITQLFATASGIFTGWDKFVMTRAENGEFTFYHNDVVRSVTVGTNPVRDNTHIDSEYISQHLYLGGEIGLKKDNGDPLWTYKPLPL
jgi:hypothetical protein